jgi:hypothetical protein
VCQTRQNDALRAYVIMFQAVWKFGWFADILSHHNTNCSSKPKVQTTMACSSSRRTFQVYSKCLFSQ